MYGRPPSNDILSPPMYSGPAGLVKSHSHRHDNIVRMSESIITILIGPRCSEKLSDSFHQIDSCVVY